MCFVLGVLFLIVCCWICCLTYGFVICGYVGNCCCLTCCCLKCVDNSVGWVCVQWFVFWIVFDVDLFCFRFACFCTVCLYVMCLLLVLLCCLFCLFVCLFFVLLCFMFVLLRVGLVCYVSAALLGLVNSVVCFYAVVCYWLLWLLVFCFGVFVGCLFNFCCLLWLFRVISCFNIWCFIDLISIVWFVLLCCLLCFTCGVWCLNWLLIVQCLFGFCNCLRLVVQLFWLICFTLFWCFLVVGALCLLLGLNRCTYQQWFGCQILVVLIACLVCLYIYLCWAVQLY